jgi:putative membrane protein
MQTTSESTRPRRGWRDYLGLTARGFCMGAADVVPGVSGGTMAFILGIYEELIQSIRMVGQPMFLRAVFRLRLKEIFQILNWPFLAAVALGIFLAIITLARSLEWMLENQPIMIWSFFFGLVLASVFVVSKRIGQWSPLLIAAAVLGTAGAYMLVGLVPAQTPESWWFLILSGALAICAMILPGISGAFILVLLGKYQFVLSAVNQRDLLTIALVGIGAVVGLVTFAQLLGWLFKRYHDLTIALLTGLMLGSLRKVWPWKIDLEFMTDRHGELVPILQQNILPPWSVNGAFNSEILVGLALALVGCTAVLLLERLAGHAGGSKK